MCNLPSTQAMIFYYIKFVKSKMSLLTSYSIAASGSQEKAQVFQFSLWSKRLHRIHFESVDFQMWNFLFYLFFQENVQFIFPMRMLYFHTCMWLLFKPNEHEIVLDCFVRSAGYFILRVSPICLWLNFYLIDINQRIRSISTFCRVNISTLGYR